MKFVTEKPRYISGVSAATSFTGTKWQKMMMPQHLMAVLLHTRKSFY
jgi:hypothetical protein